MLDEKADLTRGTATCNSCGKIVRVKAGVIQNHTRKRRGADLSRCSYSGASARLHTINYIGEVNPCPPSS